jgi:hypothetical protein
MDKLRRDLKEWQDQEQQSERTKCDDRCVCAMRTFAGIMVIVCTIGMLFSEVNDRQRGVDRDAELSIAKVVAIDVQQSVQFRYFQQNKCVPVLPSVFFDQSRECNSLLESPIVLPIVLIVLPIVLIVLPIVLPYPSSDTLPKFCKQLDRPNCLLHEHVDLNGTVRCMWWLNSSLCELDYSRRVWNTTFNYGFVDQNGTIVIFKRYVNIESYYPEAHVPQLYNVAFHRHNSSLHQDAMWCLSSQNNQWDWRKYFNNPRDCLDFFDTI